MDSSARIPPDPQQAGAIPFSLAQGDLSFCLITSSDGRRWGFPKGTIEASETPPQTALKEALEEAGVVGDLWPDQLGTYAYWKADRQLQVAVWLMEVSQTLSQWDEMHRRERRWLSAEEALRLLDRPELRELLQEALSRIREGR